MLSSAVLITGVVFMKASPAGKGGPGQQPGDIMPVVFIGHGSPMNAIQDNDFTRSLDKLGKTLPKPKVILCVSAHWVSEGTFITGSENPEQIYDFDGFPDQLYKVKYRPKGSVAAAKEVEKLLAGVPAKLSTEWGTDHGTWSILRHMYPKCDIPVIQLSLDVGKPERWHYETAKRLLSLRKQGVLIIGSGNIVHNLSMIDWGQFSEKTPDWALEFDAETKKRLDTGDDEGLIDYAKKDARAAAYAVPTNEHYLPMLYAAALRQKGEKVSYFYEGFQHGSISMRSFVIQ